MTRTTYILSMLALSVASAVVGVASYEAWSHPEIGSVGEWVPVNGVQEVQNTRTGMRCMANAGQFIGCYSMIHKDDRLPREGQ